MLRVYNMKYLLFAFSAILLDMLNTCRPTEPDYLEVNPNTVMFGYLESSATIVVSSNTHWNVAFSGEPWLEISPITGNNDAVITVTAQSNESPHFRSCTLTVTSEDVQQEVHVYQEGKVSVDN